MKTLVRALRWAIIAALAASSPCFGQLNILPRDFKQPATTAYTIGGVVLQNGTVTAADMVALRAGLGLAIGTNVPSPSGTGASGTWGISISGTAANATTATKLGTLTGIPYLTSGTPSTVTSAQINDAIGSRGLADDRLSTNVPLLNAASIVYSGAFKPTSLWTNNIYNSNQTGAYMNLSATGLQVITSTATNVPLIVNNSNASPAADLIKAQATGVDKFVVTSSGNVYASGINNSSTGSNAALTLGASGSVISRNIADANPALIVNQANASSTGNVFIGQAAGTNKFIVDKTGRITMSNGIACGLDTAPGTFKAGMTYGLYMPRLADLGDSIIYDQQDDLIYSAGTNGTNGPGTTTISHAPTSGSGVYQMFWPDSTSLSWTSASTLAAGGDLIIELDRSSDPVSAAGNGNFTPAITFRGSILPTNIKIEVWDTGSSTYAQEFNAAPSTTAVYGGAYGQWLGSRFSAPSASGYNIPKVRWTLTIPAFTGSDVFRLQRLSMYHATAQMYPWLLNRAGDSASSRMYGNLEPYKTASSNLGSPTRTWANIYGSGANLTGLTATQVGLGNVTNESKATMFASPTFTGDPKAPTPLQSNNSTSIATTAWTNTMLANYVTGTQALNYAPKASPTFTGTVSGITAAMVGLGNVTNESKATMFTSPALTGTPTVPTATAGTNTTQAASTAFVDASFAKKASPTFTGPVTTYGNVVANTGDVVIDNGPEGVAHLSTGHEYLTCSLPIQADGSQLTNINPANLSAAVPSSKGGAGTVNGLLKANGAGTTSAAVPGTDYASPTGTVAGLFADGGDGEFSWNADNMRWDSNVSIISTGGFVGSLTGNATTATSAESASTAGMLEGGGEPATAIKYSDGWRVSDSNINDPMLTVEGNVSASGFSGSGANLTGLTATQVGLGNVTNESKATMFTSPTFTGSVGIGVTPLQRLHVGYGHLRYELVADPSTAPSAALITAAGNVNAGAHYYRITFLTADGETRESPSSTVVTTDATHGQVTVTIPVCSGAGSAAVTGRKIYRTSIVDSYFWYPIATVANNTATTYTDNIADPGYMSAGYFIAGVTNNTTAGKVYVGTTPQSFAGSTYTTYGLGSMPNGGMSATSFGAGNLTSMAANATNTAFGTAVGQPLTSGSDNTMVGYQAMVSCGSTVAYNTAMGRAALMKSTSNGNVGLGYHAGYNFTSGGYNTLIGYNAGYNGEPGTALTYTKSIGIGYNATPGASNACVLGGTGSDAVKVGIGTATPTSPLHVVGLQPYANNAAAIAAGLTAGAFYRSNADPSVVCVVY